MTNYLYVSHILNFVILTLALVNSMLVGVASYKYNKHLFILLFANVFASFIFLLAVE